MKFVGSGISCPPMFLLHRHCLFSEGISSTTISLMPIPGFTAPTIQIEGTYYAVHLTRSSPAPTISSHSHRAWVLLHTGAWASAALLTYLLTLHPIFWKNHIVIMYSILKLIFMNLNYFFKEKITSEASLIPRYVPARALRSSSSLSICVPTRKTTMAASKSFSSVASGIWNALLNHLSSVPTLPVFRRALKHHLFLLAYPDSSAKSGMIKAAQYISLRDTVPIN